MKKWILAILVIVTVLILGAVAMVNMISGTSSVHQEALEQAFSDALQGRVKFEKLVNFNVAPQFIIDVEGMSVDPIKSGGSAHVKKFEIAFGFEDLALARRHIEKFNLIQLEAENIIDGIDKITLDKLTISNPDKGSLAYLEGEGALDDLPFKGRVKLKVFAEGRRSFALDDVNEAHIELGKLVADGSLEPFGGSGAMMTAVTFRYGDESCPADTPTTFKVQDIFAKMYGVAKDVTTLSSFRAFCAKLVDGT